MKRVFKFYAAIWAVLFVIFNVIAFVSPGWVGVEKYTASFWTGYIVITLAFIGQLACAWKAFNTDNLTKFFYNVPLITISYSGLVATFICGGICMLFSNLFGWVALFVCLAVVAITVLAIIKAGTAGEMVEEIDRKIETKTAFIKNLRVDAEMLAAKEENPEAKKALSSLAEKIRYSDPMSNPALADIENEILYKFNALKTSENKTSDVKEILLLLEERNKKCRMVKG